MEGPLPNPLIADRLSTNVRNQNNMAWKNVSVASAPDANGESTSVVGTGGTPDGADARLVFDEPADLMGRDSIFDWGTVFVDLGPELYGRWVAAGSLGTDVQAIGGTEVRILANGASLDEIAMDPEERFTVRARFVPDSASATLPLRSHPDSYFLDMEQYAKRAGGDEIVGGMQFVLKTYRPAFSIQVD